MPRRPLSPRNPRRDLVPADSDILTVARMLRIAGREVTRRRDAHAASLGLTSSQADALTFIREHPGCMIADLGSYSGSSHQAARTLVERLRERELIEVSVSDRDARARVLEITPRGILLHDRFLAMGAESFGNIRESFDEGEVRDLKDTLEKLMALLGLEQTVRSAFLW